jgi:predicted SprT family Zn-dependent metalloprotease
MSETTRFKFVCEICGSLAIKVDHPERAAETNVVVCARCNSPRGTLAALHELAKQGNGELYEF